MIAHQTKNTVEQYVTPTEILVRIQPCILIPIGDEITERTITRKKLSLKKKKRNRGRLSFIEETVVRTLYETGQDRNCGKEPWKENYSQDFPLFQLMSQCTMSVVYEHSLQSIIYVTGQVTAQ